MIGSINLVEYTIGVPFVLGALVGFLLLARRLRRLATSAEDNRAVARWWGRATIGLAVVWALATLWFAAVTMSFVKDENVEFALSLLVCLVGGAPAHLAAAVAVRRAIHLLGKARGDAPPPWFRVRLRGQAILEWIQAHPPYRIAAKVLQVLLVISLAMVFFGLCLPQYLVRRVLPSLGLANILYLAGGGMIGLFAGGLSSGISLSRTDKVTTPFVLISTAVLAAGVLVTLLLAMYSEGILKSL